jgi:alpha-glucosidase
MRLTDDGERLGFDLNLGAGARARGYNRISLIAESQEDEGFYGFGIQFSYFNMKGRKLPIYISEQGVGRGDEPTTTEVNKIRPGIGGDWTQTYASVPQFITSVGRGLYLDTSERAVFDMTRADRFSVELFGTHLHGGFLEGGTPLKMISDYTAAHGRMAALPAWINRGAVMGMQGGTAVVEAKVAAALKAGTPIAAVWLQDWVGQRLDPSGAKRLWWTWTVDRARYPGWEEFVARMHKQGIRVMGYINPYVADASSKYPNRRDLFAEGLKGGYFIKNSAGEPYLGTRGDYRYATLDLTNRAAWDWYKKIIKDEMVAKGLSGWMADFAESTPFDAVFSNGVDPLVYHNQYAADWARLNREAAEEAGVGKDAVAFYRSGYTDSPKFATLFWVGDQQVEWGRHDGIKSAVTGMLTSGVSGFALNHSDIGGYTGQVVRGYSVARSKELFMRWAEMSAFTPVYRTHEGDNPDANAQFDFDGETLDHYARMARMYACLAPYRATLGQEAADKGWPMVRHPYLVYPKDHEVRKLVYSQFLLGNDVFVAPVLDQGKSSVDVYLPSDGWTHIWSGRSFAKGNHLVSAPIGQPAVFVRSGSSVANLLPRCATP